MAIYRQEDAEEMFQLLLQINMHGFNELWQNFTQKTLMEITLNKNADAAKAYADMLKEQSDARNHPSKS